MLSYTAKPPQQISIMEKNLISNPVVQRAFCFLDHTKFLRPELVAHEQDHHSMGWGCYNKVGELKSYLRPATFPTLWVHGCSLWKRHSWLKCFCVSRRNWELCCDLYRLTRCTRTKHCSSFWLSSFEVSLVFLVTEMALNAFIMY